MSRQLGTVTDQVGGVAPPVGVYLVSFKSLEDIEGKFGDQWKWIFEIESVQHSTDDEAEDFVGEELHGYTSMGLGPRHKARQWIEALVGRKMSEGEPVSEDDLMGKRAYANIISYTREDGTEGTRIATEGGLAAVKKKGKKKKATAAPPPPPEPEDDDDDDEDNEDEDDFYDELPF